MGDKTGGQMRSQNETVNTAKQKNDKPRGIITMECYEFLRANGRLPTGYSKKDLTGED